MGLLQSLPVIGQLPLVVHLIDVERSMALKQVVRDLAPVLLKDGGGGLRKRLEILGLIYV